MKQNQQSQDDQAGSNGTTMQAGKQGQQEQISARANQNNNQNPDASGQGNDLDLNDDGKLNSNN